MKKEYKKPLVYIESLVVSEFIAGPCKIDVGFGEGNSTCKLTGEAKPGYEPVTYFVEDVYCDQDPRPNKSNGNIGLCYHGTTDANAYFGS